MSKSFRCTCGAACEDVGELEEHVMSVVGGGTHEPAKSQHMTARLKEHAAKRQQREQTRQKIADVLGVSVEELREALR